MAMPELIKMTEEGARPGLFQNASTFATSEPIMIPGQMLRPNRRVRAKATPDGGHVGRAVVFSKAR